MHVFFSGIGGAGIAPLALVAKQAGHTVSGSDKQLSDTIELLRRKGITDISIGQKKETIAKLHSNTPIDWLVYSSAVPKENPHHPELLFAEEMSIKATKRDRFIADFMASHNLKMLAVAGTHGKSTTTAMLVWLFKELSIPISYVVGAKLNFAEMGFYQETAEYFIYEADEYDRNFLEFHPSLSIISGIAYDHPDIYPTREAYNEAFLQFIQQSSQVVAWEKDAHLIGMPIQDSLHIQPTLFDSANFSLIGQVNKQDALLVARSAELLELCSYEEAVAILNRFPGLPRRFEELTNNLYTDYAHTPEKIRGALQTAHEVANENVVVVYEGLHNTRQHFIKEELKTLFTGTKKLYIVPSYLAREDESLEMLSPEKLCAITEQLLECEASYLDEKLKNSIAKHVDNGDLVICLSAGGGGSLDEWLRKEFVA